MTATLPTQDAAVVPEATTPRPTRKQAIAVASRAGIDRRSATQVYDWLRDKVIPACRRSRDGQYYVEEGELVGRRYEAFEAIFPHGNTGSAPGSPQAAFMTSLLDPAQGEYSLVHDMDSEQGATFCHVTITRSAV